MKRKRYLKFISALLVITLLIGSLSIGIFAYGDDLIAINSSNFKDSNFRAVVSDWYDENKDGYLSQSEIGSVTLISVSGMLTDTCGDMATIEDLSGIEYFTSCKRLRCGGIGLAKLDVTKMPQLIELTCAGNELTSLDVSKNVNLEWLNCSSCDLEELNVSVNTKLTKLECYVNSIPSLDVSKNTALTTLRCQQNELNELNLRTNTELTILNCSKNHLTSLDLSANTKLIEATDSYYGDQTVSGTALIDLGSIYVRVPVDDSRCIVSSSLDTTFVVDDVEYPLIGYTGDEFYTDDFDKMKDGIDYQYNVNLAEAENMSVHVNVLRDFWQVKFFSDESKTTVIESVLVDTGASATAPELQIPQCKAFDGWVGDYTNVTEDREVYASWRDDHDVKIIDFKDGIVTVNCKKCLELESKYDFNTMLNARTDSDKYVEIVDVNGDGIINGKDYVNLYRTFK